jgi:hypothetical protein
MKKKRMMRVLEKTRTRRELSIQPSQCIQFGRPIIFISSCQQQRLRLSPNTSTFRLEFELCAYISLVGGGWEVTYLDPTLLFRNDVPHDGGHDEDEAENEENWNEE